MNNPKPTPELIALVRVSLFQNICHFGDVEMQKKKWLSTTLTNPYYSYVECMCNYFDGSLVQQNLEQLEIDGFISEAEIAIIKPFHLLADVHKSPTDDYDHDSILKDPQWHIIQNAAQAACTNLLSIVSCEEEKIALLPEKMPNKSQ